MRGFSFAFIGLVVKGFVEAVAVVGCVEAFAFAFTFAFAFITVDFIDADFVFFVFIAAVVARLKP